MCSDLSTNESLISVRTSNIKMHIEYFFQNIFFRKFLQEYYQTGKQLLDLILYVPSTVFQLNRDGSSWVEPVLS